MKRRESGGVLEFAVGPHPARDGWEVARITYNSADPEHERRVEAAITALVHARGVRTPERTATAVGGAPCHAEETEQALCAR